MEANASLPNANLVVDVYSIAPDGKATLITRGGRISLLQAAYGDRIAIRIRKRCEDRFPGIARNVIGNSLNAVVGAADLIAGHTQLIARARARGLPG